MRGAAVRNDGEAPTGIQISPTARLTADLRRHADIPLADAIAQLTDAAGFARAMPTGGLPADVRRWMAPLIEARYRCLVAAIEQAGVSQVLELAAGFAFRGVAMAARSGLLYVETDLPAIHRQRETVRDLLERDYGAAAAASCVFAAADMLSQADLDRVAALLRPDAPVAIVHEGIFPYFSAEEKDVAAANIARLLRRFGGVWLTPDFKSGDDGVERLWRSESAQMVGRYLGATTGRPGPRDRSLSDEAKVHAFLARHGLRGEKRRAVPDATTLSSARRLGTPATELAALQSGLAIWAIRHDDDPCPLPHRPAGAERDPLARG